MTRDRLSELRRNNTSGVGGNSVDLGDVELGSVSKDSGEMTKFFEEVGAIRVLIRKIKDNVNTISQLHSNALVIISEEQSKQNSSELDKLVQATQDINKDVQRRLNAIEKSNAEFSSKHKDSADDRMRLSQQAALTKKFTEVISEFQEIQNSYKAKYKDRVQRHFKIVKPDATPEEIEKVTSSEGGAIFARQILPNSAQRAEARDALRDIEERHQDILMIERSIIELHQLFVDMAILVEKQASLIQQIDKFVDNAIEYTEKGVQEMKTAVKLQKAARKKMCWIIICVIVLVLIIVAIAVPTSLLSS